MSNEPCQLCGSETRTVPNIGCYESVTCKMCGHVNDPVFRLKEKRSVGPGPGWKPLWKIRDEMIGK